MPSLQHLIEMGFSAADRKVPVCCGEQLMGFYSLLRVYLPDFDPNLQFDGRKFSFKFCGAEWISASSAEQPSPA